MSKKPIKLLSLVFALLTAASLAACTSAAPAAANPTTAPKPTKLVIAYLPNEADEKMAEYRSQFANDLSKAIGIPVEEFLATDYNATVEAMRTKKCDVAFFGPLTFSLAYERAGAEPLVVIAKNADKSKAVYQSLLVTKADNAKLNSVKDIKGCTFAFVDPNSTSGNLVPSAEIMKAFPDLNLTMDDLHTNGKFFSSVSFSGKHQAGLAAVLNGDVDCVPIASDILATEIRNGNAKESDVKIIHTSVDIPGSPFAIRGDFNPELKAQIKAFMISYTNETYFEKFQGDKTKRFVDCTVDDYKGVIELNKKLNP